ncbi:MAG: peptidase U32 family protein [Patescibacteria group bacterium]
MVKNRYDKPELLAPAGDLERLKIAFLYGADAVYCGVPEYGMRVKEIEFDLESLEEGVRFAHELGKRVYITVNIFAHNENFNNLPDFLHKLEKIGVDGLIVADPGILQVVWEEKIKIPIHLSTQANVTNWKSVEFWMKNNINRVVLARELSHLEISEIKKRLPKANLEIFVHGALCMSVSGRCHISNYFNKRDANRGNCSHCCRWEYNVYVEEKTRPGEMMLVEEDERGSYFFNSKDLCLIDCMDEVLKTGAMSLKIEGRNKTEFYVATVVRAYRQALDMIFDDLKSYKKNKKKFVGDLMSINTRGFTHGFFMENQADISNYNERSGGGDRQYVGKVIGRVGELTKILAKNQMKLTDEFELFSPSTTHKLKIKEFLNDQEEKIGEVVNTNDIFFIKNDFPLPDSTMIRKVL